MTPYKAVHLGRSVMGQADTMNPATVKAVGATIGAFSVTLAAATTWVGFSTGRREKGLLSVAGYVVGAFGAVSAALDLFGIGALLLSDSASIQKLIDEKAAESPAIAGRRSAA